MQEAIVLSGIVVSSTPVGEYDKRVVLLTKEQGKISAFARGARKPTSPLLAGTRTFCFGKFTIYEGRTANSIVSIELVETFDKLSNDIEAVSYGFYFLEMATYYAVEYQEATSLINLLYVTIKALLNHRISNELIRLIFELRMFVVIGEYPNVFSCVNCKAELKEGYFSAVKRGVLCENCKKEAKDTVKVQHTALYALQYIVAVPVEKLYNFTLSEEIFLECKACIDRYKLLYVNHEFNSLAVLKSFM